MTPPHDIVEGIFVPFPMVENIGSMRLPGISCRDFFIAFPKAFVYNEFKKVAKSVTNSQKVGDLCRKEAKRERFSDSAPGFHDLRAEQ